MGFAWFELLGGLLIGTAVGVLLTGIFAANRIDELANSPAPFLKRGHIYACPVCHVRRPFEDWVGAFSMGQHFIDEHPDDPRAMDAITLRAWRS